MEVRGVSTILPVWLEEPAPERLSALLRAADSVLAQDCAAPRELLVIDDGSPAPLREISSLRGLLGREDVNLIRLARNQGLVFALNAGLNRARYDLIARIDADDRWLPGKLARQLEAFAADPDLTLVGTGVQVVGPDGRPPRRQVPSGSWKGLLEFMAMTGCPLAHGSILARKDIFLLLGGYPHDPAYRHCEDYALWSVWARFFKCGLVDEVLFEYTVSGWQISARHAAGQRAATALVEEKLRGLGNCGNIPPAIERLSRAWQKSLLDTGRILFQAWRHFDRIVADPELREAAAAALPDRSVSAAPDLEWRRSGRLFYLHKDGTFASAS